MTISSTFRTLKSLGNGQFEGLAWAYSSTPDQSGDVITPKALQSAVGSSHQYTSKSINQIPVLVEHSGDPVGLITSAKVEADGLRVAGQVLPDSDAFKRMRSGELTGLSIGFGGYAQEAGPLRIWDQIRLEEISICRAPVNKDSLITAVKSWTQLSSAAELEHRLKSFGMPHKLARKTALSAWPHIETQDEPDTELLSALRRFANQ